METQGCEIVRASIWSHEDIVEGHLVTEAQPVEFNKTLECEGGATTENQGTQRDSEAVASTAGKSDKKGKIVTYYSVHVINKRGESRELLKRFNDFNHLLRKLKTNHRELVALLSLSKINADVTGRTNTFNALMKLLIAIRPCLPEVAEFFGEPWPIVENPIFKPLYIRYKLTIPGFEETYDSYGSKVTQYFIVIEDQETDGMAHLRKKRYSDFSQLYQTLLRTHPEIHELYFPPRALISSFRVNQHRRDTLQNLCRILLSYYPPIQEFYSFLGMKLSSQYLTEDALENKSL